MAVARIAKRTRGTWIMWILWAAGVGLLLVELNAATAYLQAGLQQNMGDLLGCGAAMVMITLKVAEQSAWHWGTLGPVLQALPVGTLGLLLVAVGLAATKVGNVRGKNVQQ